MHIMLIYFKSNGTSHYGNISVPPLLPGGAIEAQADLARAELLSSPVSSRWQQTSLGFFLSLSMFKLPIFNHQLPSEANRAQKCYNIGQKEPNQQMSFVAL